MSTIYHLITSSQWELSRQSDNHEAETLTTEGFIHCSGSIEQLLRVANRLYAEKTDMLALSVDRDKLTSQLIEEPSRSGEIYPHIYGPLNVDAVSEILEFVIESGIFIAVKPSASTHNPCN